MVSSLRRPFLALAAVLATASARHFSMSDIQEFVDQLGDEIMSHEGLRAPVPNSIAEGIHDLASAGVVRTKKLVLKVLMTTSAHKTLKLFCRN